MWSHWRRIARPIIARVLGENAGKPDAEIRAALRAAYPFGVRRHYPYRVWLDEIARQTGKPSTGRFRRRRVSTSDPSQGSLLGGSS